MGGARSLSPAAVFRVLHRDLPGSSTALILLILLITFVTVMEIPS